jgi:DNA-binding transcriptional regulator YdaS (Cro superfamily)
VKPKFSVEDRRRLAALAGINQAYLYQCLTGRRDMGPVEARRVERATNGELTRRDLCGKTWRLIWPELLDVHEEPFSESTARA